MRTTKASHRRARPTATARLSFGSRLVEDWDRITWVRVRPLADRVVYQVDSRGAPYLVACKGWVEVARIGTHRIAGITQKLHIDALSPFTPATLEEAASL